MYLTTAELASYLGYEGKRKQGAAQKWIARTGIRCHWRSERCKLVKRSDVDAIVSGQQQTKRRAACTNTCTGRTV